MIGEELVQLLTPEGERVAHPEYESTLSGEEIFGLYRDMVIVRRLCTESTSLQRQGQLALSGPGEPSTPRISPFRPTESTELPGVAGCPPKTCCDSFERPRTAAGTPRSIATRCPRWSSAIKS